MSCGTPSHNLLQLDEVIALIAKAIQPVARQEAINLDDALHRVTAEAVVAPYALPPFDNTGVDGYALRHADLGKDLFIVGNSFAGEGFAETLREGCAIHIATGAPLPDGADTVVMQEDCTVENGKIIINKPLSKGANIRRAGNDIAAGIEAVPAARRLKAGDIAMLGALGLTTVVVKSHLRIGIASTGNEIRSAGSKLAHGQIIDTNSMMLRQLLSGWSDDVRILGALPDDRAKTDEFLLHAAKDYDLILTTGGVSVGQRDFIRDALQALGKIHFWKTAIRPGRPVMLGTIHACQMLALPGNPVSAYVTFYLIALPLLQALYGMKPSLPQSYLVTLGEDIRKEPHLRSFPRATLSEGKNGPIATPYRDQSSNLISSLVRADGLLDLPVGTTEFKAGDLARFMLLRG